MEYKTVTKMISIKRRIEPDDRLIHFIRHNSNKRRYIWNKFVENYKEVGYKNFDPNDVRKRLAAEDKAIIKSPDTDPKIKEMHCSDIVLSVYKDIKQAIKIMRTRYKKTGKISELRYKTHDSFRKTFRVRTRNDFCTKSDKLKGKVIFKNTTDFKFIASTRHVQNEYHIHLLEPIADEYDDDIREFVAYDKHSHCKRYDFHHDDIKQIVFMEDLGKYYIMLQCEVTYYNKKSEMKCRRKIAGIDLGIHNPVTIYNGERTIFTAMNSKQMARLQYYERRIRKLDSAMDKKYSINKKRNALNPSYPLYSKRYRKIQYRFRRYNRQVVNIRRDWRFKLASLISLMYKNIVVDEFITPDNKTIKPNKLRRFYNHYNRNHAMFSFMEVLKHVANKNGCNYIDSPDDTTRACSICGHKNPKLPLSERYLNCENCGNVIDRDMNAAMNCYDFYFNRNHWSKD